MAYNVAALVDYVIENQDLLVTKSIFGAKTIQLIMSESPSENIMTGIKFAEKINKLDTDAIFQPGSGCTRTSSGTTTFTQRQVTVGEIAVVEDICIKDLNKKYTSKALKAGSNANDMPFEQEYTDLKTKTISKQMEIAVWQGDTASGNANLSRFDGLIKQMDAAAAAVNGNPTGITTGTGITTTNIKGIVDGMWTLIPPDVDGQDDIRIFCGWDVFKTFISAYRDQNLFAFAPVGNEVNAKNGEVVIPGTTYRLTAVHGLDSTKRLFTLRMSNLFYGTDLENEEEKWSIMEDQFKDYLRFKSQWKSGINVAFPNEIVSFNLV